MFLHSLYPSFPHYTRSYSLVPPLFPQLTVSSPYLFGGRSEETVGSTVGYGSGVEGLEVRTGESFS